MEVGSAASLVITAPHGAYVDGMSAEVRAVASGHRAAGATGSQAARAQRREVRRQDLQVAAAAGALWTAGLVVASRWDYWIPASSEAWWCAGAGLVAALAVRRWAARAGFWAVSGGYLVAYSLVLDGGRMPSFVHVIPLLVTTYAVTRAGAEPPVLAAVVAGALGVTLQAGVANAAWGLSTWDWHPAVDLSSAVQLVALVVAAALLGAMVHRLARTSASLAERNAQLVALQEVRAREAVAAERTRIARELHDVVAHHVSAIVVRAQAADRVADAQPDAPREAVRWIAPAGKEALDAMRSVVRVLRAADEEAAPYAPTAGLDALPGVLARVREAGLDVRATLPDPLPACAPQVGLAVVRVAQEALTNVLVHSAAPHATVTLTRSATDVVLEVTDPGPPRPPTAGTGLGGNGLLHMRERAAAAGASVVAGALPGGGWRVRLVVPLDRLPEDPARRAPRREAADA
ncbi:hypothetical protein CUD01_20760 [Cellulomonas uda]|uniref:histidine kinase n=2 Tax=Cellulomonas uda TaxID=1714 RepID=A0A4Y3KCF3_CELUD|nr:hypothetical protein CUD01_20760 [Cellulomonas uda]